ncbi:MAG: hypothetical protein KA346_00975 [Neisseriaceae bacterium]|nr:hypothetical protein [Neisseriaceae bacterium]
MKKYYVSSLLITVFLAGCATPSKHYEKLLPLNEVEKQSLTCIQLDQEVSKIQGTLTDIGEVSTADAAMANVGIGAAILRASLGGFNSKDMQLSVDVKEQQDAIQKANDRLLAVTQLQTEKKCLSNR